MPDDNSPTVLTAETQYAGFWIRTAASLIDSVLLLLVVSPLLHLIYGADYWASENLAAGFWDVLLNYVLPALAVIVFWVARSATPGKMILDLKIVDARSGHAFGHVGVEGIEAVVEGFEQVAGN